MRLTDKKWFWYLIWLVLITIGACTCHTIPAEAQYTYGFFFGSICLVPLMIGKDL